MVNAIAQYEAELHRLRNQPRPYLPPWFQPELTRIGGIDSLSGQPLRKIVWGQSVEAMKMALKDKHVNDLIVDLDNQKEGLFAFKQAPVEIEWRPKYPGYLAEQTFRVTDDELLIEQVVHRAEMIPRDRYYIEKFIPVSKIPRDVWEIEWRFYVDPETGIKEDVMGPFPIDGQYVEWMCLENPQTKEMWEPNRLVLEEVARKLDWEHRFDSMSPRQLLKLKHSIEKSQQEQRDLRCIERLSRIMKEHHRRRTTTTVNVLTDRCASSIVTL